MIIGPTAHKGEVFGGLGLIDDGINVPFSICHLPTAPVYPLSPLLSTPGALVMTPRVPMGPKICWKSCATLPWRSWTLSIALKFRPLRGRKCAAPAGPIWKKQTFMSASSCKLGCDAWPVRWTPCFFECYGHCHGCFFVSIWQHWKNKKCEIDRAGGKWSDMQTWLARGAATDCLPLIPQSTFERSRCFHKDTKGADGAADLLEVLRNSPLEKLNFEHCSQIPSAAWQKLRGASWTNLREANFYRCLVLQTWLRCLASSLRHRVFSNVKGHCHGRFFDNIWQHWQVKNVKSGANGRTCKSHLQEERPFIDSPDKMAYLCHPLTWHIVIFSRLPKPLRCAIAIYSEFHRQLEKLPRTPYVSSWWIQWGTPPINGTAFKRCIHSLWACGYLTNGKRIINLFYWFACPRACH